MKKAVPIICLLLISLITYSQPTLYGLTTYGTISKYNAATDSLSSAFTFNTDGLTPAFSNGVVKAVDGKLYGMTRAGGGFGSGVIFSFDPVTASYRKLKDFEGWDGGSPFGTLVQARNNLLYGMTLTGGKSHNGVIFSFNPATSTYTKIIDLDSAGGYFPYGSLALASNGLMYGMTLHGGSYNFGVIFSFDPQTNTFTKLKDFNRSDGIEAYGNLVQGINGKLYGMTRYGGDFGRGVIFSFDPLNSTYRKLRNLDYANGSDPYGNLIQGSNGKLYGMTNAGGNTGKGVVFSLDPITLAYTKLKDFDGIDGAFPYGSLVANNGLLYGMTPKGGLFEKGVMFSIDLASSTYQKLKDFNQTSGNDPYGNLIDFGSGKLYGMTRFGGTDDRGLLFSYDINTAAYTIQKEFTNANGTTPHGSMIRHCNGNFYGTTTTGGAFDRGVMFSFDPNTDTYTKLKNFTGIDGAAPYGSLADGASGILYGMTRSGGTKNLGVLFSFDITANTYAKQLDFDGTNGSAPIGHLTLGKNGKLYGMTMSGGTNNTGVLFSFDPRNQVYNKLKDLGGADGHTPLGSLVQHSDGRLYGMMLSGGVDNRGVLFSIDSTGADYTRHKDFDGINGNGPHGSLVEGKDGKLYGMTASGGVHNDGDIFSFDPVTKVYARLHDFRSEEGMSPTGSLFLASDGKLYGMTYVGGSQEYGVVFSFDPVTLTYHKLQDFNLLNGGRSLYGSLVESRPQASRSYYRDLDGDGFGNPDRSIQSCFQPAGYVAINTDCDDARSDIHPGAREICGNTVDENCNGILNDGCIVTRSIKVNVYGGSNPYNNAAWNDWNITASLGSGPLRYSEATTSSISAVLSSNTTLIDNGVSFGASGGMAPAPVLRYTSYTLSARTLILSGLLQDATYSLELYSGRNNSGGKSTIFTINGHSITVLSDRNTSKSVLFTDLAPDSAGKLVVTIKGTDRYNYLNGFVLTENGNSSSLAPVANAGEDRNIVLPANTTTLSGSGIDEDGTIISYKWIRVSGPATFTINSPTTATTEVSDLVEGTYIFRLTVTADDGATDTDDVQVLVKSVPPPVPGKYVKVNVYGGLNPFNHPEWTDWNVTSSLGINSLKYSDGTTSSITAALSASSGIIDNGSTFGAGMAPAQVLRYTSYTLSARTLTLSGLTPGSAYSIALYSSRNNSGSKSTVFTVNGQSKTVLSDRNLNNEVAFENISADLNGRLVILIKGSDRYNFLNGFILTQSGSASSTIAQSTMARKEVFTVGSDLQLSAYPNPSSQFFTLRINGVSSAAVTVRVLDVTGRVVETRQQAPGKGSMILGVRYRPGIYFIEARQGLQRKTLKIIKGVASDGTGPSNSF